jgi:xylulokinase
MLFVAGIDSSTQSCTVVLRDLETGTIIASASSPHPPTSAPRSEQHPASWWQALKLAWEQALAKVDRMLPAAVCIDGQGHGLVVLDHEDQIIRPAKLWNDTESTSEARELVAKLGPAEWVRRTGIVPKAAFTITKLLWLARHEPESFARIHHILLPHDWLVYRLTGKRATERSEASGTGYFSPWLAEWQPDLLGLIDPSIDWMARLPEIVPPGKPVGTILPDAAREIGLPSGIPVSGLHDNAATALGLGIHLGDVVISLGTSGTIFALHPEPVKDEMATVDGNADATGQYLPLVCVLNATQVTDMVCRLLQVNHQELAQLALQAPARPDRAVLLAYLNGERNPDRPYSRGVLAGIRSDLTRGELARAAFEGVLCGLYRGYKALQRVGVRTDGRLLLTGGGAASPAYRQFAADIFQRAVSVPDLADTAACGAAIVAAAAIHKVSISEQAARWAPSASTVAEPGSQGSDLLLERYEKLVKGERFDDV